MSYALIPTSTTNGSGLTYPSGAIATTDELFFGTKGPRQARIMVIGESWGAEEERKQKPFVGKSGQELDRMLVEAGIEPATCLFTNVIAKRPAGNEVLRFFTPTQEAKAAGRQPAGGLYPEPWVADHLWRLKKLIEHVKPTVIIGFGNYTLWALTDGCHGVADKDKRKIPTGITSWRGSQLYTRPEFSSIPFVPTYHPAAIMRQWEWRSAAVHDLRTRVPKALTGDFGEPDYRFRLRPSFAEVMATIDEIEAIARSGNGLDLTVDVERQHGPSYPLIACCGLGWSELDAICIPFFSLENKHGYWSPVQEYQIVRRLRELFGNPRIRIVGQNFIYDLQYFALWWACIPDTYMDTLIAHHLLWPGTPRGLGYLSSLYCSYHRYWKDDNQDWEADGDEERQWRYNCADCVTTWECTQSLKEQIYDAGLIPQFRERMDTMHMAVRSMLRGMRIDLKARSRIAGELLEAIAPRQQWLRDLFPWYKEPKGAKPWTGSPQQQCVIFYDLLGIKEVRSRKTGSRTTDDEALDIIGRREPLLQPVVECIQELRSIKIFKSNFVDAKLDPDSRMRCTLDIAGTETFRASSYKNAAGKGCNMQTIPKGTEDE